MKAEDKDRYIAMLKEIADALQNDSEWSKAYDEARQDIDKAISDIERAFRDSYYQKMSLSQRKSVRKEKVIKSFSQIVKEQRDRNHSIRKTVTQETSFRGMSQFPLYDDGYNAYVVYNNRAYPMDDLEIAINGDFPSEDGGDVDDWIKQHPEIVIENMNLIEFYPVYQGVAYQSYQKGNYALLICKDESDAESVLDLLKQLEKGPESGDEDEGIQLDEICWQDINSIAIGQIEDLGYSEVSEADKFFIERGKFVIVYNTIEHPTV